MPHWIDIGIQKQFSLVFNEADSPAEGALVEESRKRAVSDEYLMFYS